MKRTVLVLFGLAGLIAAESALAWTRVGVYMGAPYPYFGDPFFYPNPYFSPPQPVVVQEVQPPVYVQQEQPVVTQTPAVQSSNVWYHCDKPDGYYPYVQNCPTGWKTVPAMPPSNTPAK